MSTQHVVLVTYGEPPNAAFFDQLQYSWRILLGLTRTIAPIPRALLPIIAVARGRSRTATWRAEQYSSPLEPITIRQAHALDEALRTREPGRRWQVHVAYEFRNPLLSDVLKSLPADDPVVVAPMYAADSAFTHQLSRTTASALAHARPLATEVKVLPALSADTLADLAAAHVLARTNDGWQGPHVALVLAAHGTLVAPKRPVETGLVATESIVAAIRARLADRFGLVVNGWLNHTRGGRWTEPAMDDALQQVKDAGFQRAVYYPYGFLADNAETELEGRVALRKQPSLEAKHLPCLNDSPALATALADQILSLAGSATLMRAS